jgi:short-subunit dehydrogenase
VLLTARDETSGEQAARTLRAEGLEVRYEPLDVTSTESREALARRLEREGVRLGTLVNNAGVALEGFNARVAEVTVMRALPGGGCVSG